MSKLSTLLAVTLTAALFALPALAKKVTRPVSVSTFITTCKSKIADKKKAAAVCECIVSNLQIKKVSSAEFEALTKSYKKSETEDEQTNSQLEMLYEFEEELAEKCLKNPNFRIQP